MNPKLRIDFNQKMNVIRHHFHFDQLASGIIGDTLQDDFQSGIYAFDQNFPSIFWTPNDVVLARVDYVSIVFVLHAYHYIALGYILQTEFQEKQVPFIPMPKGRGFLGFFGNGQNAVIL